VAAHARAALLLLVRADKEHCYGKSSIASTQYAALAV
jgi:hypothetical protein